MLYYMPTQLRHHEVAQPLLGNLPPKGVERQILSSWRQNVEFHIDAIDYTRLKA
jgi:hypothetical protein